jgi:hypothetical protein
MMQILCYAEGEFELREINFRFKVIALQFDEIK